MGRIFVGVTCVGAGFWLGSYRLVPLWAILVLAFIGAGLWLLAKWLERRESDR